MSTVIAMAPSPAPSLDRTAYGADAPTAQNSMPSPATRNPALLPPPPPPPALSVSRSDSRSPKSSQAPSAKSSPLSASRSQHAGPPPKIIVKKEPSSPDLPGARHRPRRLDLSKNNSTARGNLGTSRPLTGRESGGLGIQEVGLACLSPGFVTQDPIMKEQLQRSLDVREHQRQIIEQRLQQSARGDGPDHSKDRDGVGSFSAKTPGLARKRGAPPGLSIVAPSHEQFANERVIQSAPLGQTFTGRHHPHPMTRHVANQPSNLCSTSHIHPAPAGPHTNRLPPISDVFGGRGLPTHSDSGGHNLYSQQARAPLASPSRPPHMHHQPPHTSRSREYKSAEEAQVELTGGRPELLPKLVHYGGHQPPTPPSPQQANAQRSFPDASRSGSKRRTRAEYEEGTSPPLGNGRSATRRGPFGEGRDSPESQRAKKEEFLRICERAWDLFHS